jgi:hypothetical protein
VGNGVCFELVVDDPGWSGNFVQEIIMPRQETFPCPGCGEDVPAGAKACPHCGACGKSGWNEESVPYDGLDLSEEDFNYEKFVQDEFGEPRKPRGKELFWKITGAVLLVVITILVFANMFSRQ